MTGEPAASGYALGLAGRLGAIGFAVHRHRA
jgi:hypothetical protein